MRKFIGCYNDKTLKIPTTLNVIAPEEELLGVGVAVFVVFVVALVDVPLFCNWLKILAANFWLAGVAFFSIVVELIPEGRFCAKTYKLNNKTFIDEIGTGLIKVHVAIWMIGCTVLCDKFLICSSKSNICKD